MVESVHLLLAGEGKERRNISRISIYCVGRRIVDVRCAFRARGHRWARQGDAYSRSSLPMDPADSDRQAVIVHEELRARGAYSRAASAMSM